MRNEYMTKYQKNSIVLNAIYYIVSHNRIKIYSDMLYGMETVARKLYPYHYHLPTSYYYYMVSKIVDTYHISVNYVYPHYIKDYANEHNIQLFEPVYFDVNFSSANKP